MMLAVVVQEVVRSAPPVLDWTQIIIAVLSLVGVIVAALAPLYVKVWRNARTHNETKKIAQETKDLARGIDGAVNQKEDDEPTLREYAKQAAKDAATAALGMEALNDKLDIHTFQDTDRFNQLHEDQVEIIRLVGEDQRT